MIKSKKGAFEIDKTTAIILIILFLVVALLILGYFGKGLISQGNNVGSIFRRAG